MAASAQVIPFPERAPAEEDAPARPLRRLKKDFINAIGSKSQENRESAEAERYFHGVQWTQKDLKTLSDRGQPPVTYNRIKRKINTICGIIERLRMDPKALPRNPQRAAEDGAEVATKTLSYALGWNWNDLAVTVARRCAVRGLSGCELVLVQGDQGEQDPEIQWDEVDQRDFFYDPRSYRHDFSDARFLGTTRWIELDEALEAWPEFEEELRDYTERHPVPEVDRGDERREVAWTTRQSKKIRLCDHWYKLGSKWHYAIYCGEIMLEFGESYLRNEKGESVHKFEMMSYEVDQDGDRYGAFRDLKSPQDEINQRRSKGLHSLNNRKVVADAGAVDDVEIARREYARADGWVVKNPGKELITEDAATQAIVQGNLTLLDEAKAEIDTFGPNPGLIGSEIPAESGRAIKLLQAAGIAELGTYMMAYKQWRLRVYRKTWCAVQQIWQQERWIRVTDDENLSQFIQVNGWQKDETGNVAVLNQLAALDVDMVIEEGNDTTTTMEDTFDTIVALGKGGAAVPPEMLIELSPLPSSVKQRILQQLAQAQQPKPMDQQAMMLQLQLVQAQIMELQSRAMKNEAGANKDMAEGQAKLMEVERGPQQQIDTAADLAKARLDEAKTDEIRFKMANPERPPETPGLFELNQAKRDEALSRADLARTQSDMAWQKGSADNDTARVEQLLKQAQAYKLSEDAAKVAAERRTIDEAPPGMLTKPPPRPVTVPSVGKKR